MSLMVKNSSWRSGARLMKSATSLSSQSRTCFSISVAEILSIVSAILPVSRKLSDDRVGHMVWILLPLRERLGALAYPAVEHAAEFFERQGLGGFGQPEGGNRLAPFLPLRPADQ